MKATIENLLFFVCLVGLAAFFMVDDLAIRAAGAVVSAAAGVVGLWVIHRG